MVQIPQVHGASREDRAEIAYTLRRTTEATADLWREVDQIVEEIQEHQRLTYERVQGRERQQINKFLGTVSRQVGKLGQHLADLDPNTARVIRQLLGERLAELLSHRGFAELLDEPMSYEISRRAQMSREWTTSR